MDRRGGSASREAPVERFTPTTGSFAGWVGVALAVLTLANVAVFEHTATGAQLGSGAAFLAVLVWVTQLRPRATAYESRLVIHGSLRDIAIPLSLVDEVTMGQTLNVRAAGRRYVCVGIGRTLGLDVRQQMRERGSGGLLGANRVSQIRMPTDSPASSPGTTYQDFVLSRITDLVTAARPAPRAGERPEEQVRRTYAVPEIAGLVVTGVAFVASLVLL